MRRGGDRSVAGDLGVHPAEQAVEGEERRDEEELREEPDDDVRPEQRLVGLAPAQRVGFASGSGGWSVSPGTYARGRP
jgi:hypothetical protein